MSLTIWDSESGDDNDADIVTFLNSHLGEQGGGGALSQLRELRIQLDEVDLQGITGGSKLLDTLRRREIEIFTVHFDGDCKEMWWMTHGELGVPPFFDLGRVLAADVSRSAKRCGWF